MPLYKYAMVDARTGLGVHRGDKRQNPHFDVVEITGMRAPEFDKSGLVFFKTAQGIHGNCTPGFLQIKILIAAIDGVLQFGAPVRHRTGGRGRVWGIPQETRLSVLVVRVVGAYGWETEHELWNPEFTELDQ